MTLNDNEIMDYVAKSLSNRKFSMKDSAREFLRAQISIQGERNIRKAIEANVGAFPTGSPEAISTIVENQLDILINEMIIISHGNEISEIEVRAAFLRFCPGFWPFC